jgi:hypothetical protein
MGYKRPYRFFVGHNPLQTLRLGINFELPISLKKLRFLAIKALQNLKGRIPLLVIYAMIRGEHHT